MESLCIILFVKMKNHICSMRRTSDRGQKETLDMSSGDFFTESKSDNVNPNTVPISGKSLTACLSLFFSNPTIMPMAKL